MNNLAQFYGDWEKLHTVSINPEHAGKVTTLYTINKWDAEEVVKLKTELIEMKASGDFKLVARPVIQKIRPLRQLKLPEMKWLVIA